MILYIENPKDSTRKLLELINEYNKVAGYKINTQKSLVFLYTNNEKTEREIKETITFTTAMKRITSVSSVTQSCLTLSNLMDCSLPGSSVHGIFQARVLEWGAIAFSETYLRRQNI